MKRLAGKRITTALVALIAVALLGVVLVLFALVVFGASRVLAAGQRHASARSLPVAR